MIADTEIHPIPCSHLAAKGGKLFFRASTVPNTGKHTYKKVFIADTNKFFTLLRQDHPSTFKNAATQLTKELNGKTLKEYLANNSPENPIETNMFMFNTFVGGSRDKRIESELASQFREVRYFRSADTKKPPAPALGPSGSQQHTIELVSILDLPYVPISVFINDPRHIKVLEDLIGYAEPCHRGHVKAENLSMLHP